MDFLRTFKPGQSISQLFLVRDQDNRSASATGTPTCQVRDGAGNTVGDIAVTLANPIFNVWVAQFVVPSDYAEVPVFFLYFSAVVGGFNYAQHVTFIPADPSPTGDGPNPVNFTVTDGTTPLGGASVRLYDGGTSYAVNSTGVDGIASFSVPTGVYTLSITRPGYAFAAEQVTVEGAVSGTKVMTLNATAPAADPALCNCTLTVYDKQNNPVSGALIQIALLSTDGAAGRSFPRDYVDYTSNGAGVVSASLLRKAKYRARRKKDSVGWGDWKEFETPNAASFTIPEVLGRFSN
jgi:hypothetical protein